MNKTASAKAAKYKAKSENAFQVIGYQNFIKLQDKIEKWLDENGLSELKLKQKLVDLMEAKETKFFAYQGEVVDKRDVEALEVQRKTLDMALKVKKMYPRDGLLGELSDENIEEINVRFVKKGDVVENRC